MLAFNPRILGNTYWSKDIILLVTDESVRGMQAWLDAYHGVNFGSKYFSANSVIPSLPQILTYLIWKWASPLILCLDLVLYRRP
jgi:hypothetical protein